MPADAAEADDASDADDAGEADDGGDADDADDDDAAEADDADANDLGFAAADVNQIYVLFLSIELLKIKEDLIKGFPHIGVCPWLAATSCVSCLGLFFVER